MAATALQIAQLRRMVGEPTATTYDDPLLASYIERYALLDQEGQEPYTWDKSTLPPTTVVNTAWVATYDIHAAAGDIWEEKASAEVTAFDFTADGATYNRSQRYEQMMAQARWHRARRTPTTMTLVQWPEDGVAFPWIGNLPEAD